MRSPTVSKNPRCGDLYTGENPDVIKYGASIAVTLAKVHERSDVDALGAVANSRAYGDGNIVCVTENWVV